MARLLEQDIPGLVTTYIHSLLWYMRRTWPLTLLYVSPQVEPSKSTKVTILKVMKLIRKPKIKHEDIMCMLNTLPTSENWLSVLDPDTGFDLLQVAVISRQIRLVEYLVIQLDCNLDLYKCSPPVHLAAYLGDAKMLEMLLKMGAKFTKRHGMCYPEPHHPIRQQSSLLEFLGLQQSSVYLCSSHCVTPVSCAIRGDNLLCVKTLLHHHNLQTKYQSAPPLGVSPLSLLMAACREGAPRCIRFLVGRYPECINCYMDGDTPLLAAVPWGENCAHILLESGADVHQRSQGIQETALHRLYRQNIDGLFTIYDTTKWLLTTGIEQEVNAYTHLGETPLHMLVSHVSYTGGNYVDPQREKPRAELQQSYQKQVVAAVRLLLEFNADPHLLNSPGLTSLSRMLHISLKAVNRDDPCPCVSSAQPDMFVVDYQHNYSIIADVLEILLEFGSDPNFKCDSSHTPLILLLQLLMYDKLSNICWQREAVIRCFVVLLTKGAEPNFTDAAGKASAYTLVSAMCRRCLDSQISDGSSAEGTTESAKLKEHDMFAGVINDVLTVLLQFGLDPNITTSKVTQHLQGGHGNGLIELVRLAGGASTDREFDYIGRWLQTLLQYGADPDLEPYPSEPIICHCQSSIFLKKLGTQPVCHFVHEIKDKERLLQAPAVQRVLLLFYMSMSHNTLHTCLSAARSSLHLQPALTSHADQRTSLSELCDGTLDLPAVLMAMGDNPRSLKEISRVSIYKSLCRQLHDNVDSLPLPHVVKKYLIEPIF